MLMRPTNRGEHGIAIRDIERQSQNRIAIGRNEIDKRLRLPRRGHDTVATLEGSLAPDPAETARSTGDEPNLFRRHEDYS